MKWSSGKSSWLQIQRSGFDSPALLDFVRSSRGWLSLMNTIKDLLGQNSSWSGLEIREYGREDPLPWPRYILYPQMLELTSPISGGRSVGTVRSLTQIAEFFSGLWIIEF
jgi:hypothetical protein